MKNRPGIISIILILVSINAFAEDPVIVTRLIKDITFDGIPDENAWEGVVPLNTYMFQPYPDGQPTEKTEILLAYTDDYLWIGGRFYDNSPEKIKANTKKRDDFGDQYDFFGIMIDGLNSNETGFIFSTTPQATRLDLVIFNDGKDEMPFNSSWNTYWDVKTTITDQGWFMEMRIPFSSLRFKEVNDITTMGITAYRWIPHKNEMVTFPKIDPRYGKWAKQRPSLGNDIIFKGINQKNPVYIAPYIIGGQYNTWDLNTAETGYPHLKENTLEPGLDIKYSLNSNLTLDITLNTDFAQVENDDQKVNMSRFSLFQPEKRQFFQERSDIFNYSLGREAYAFYSRSIGLNEDEKVRIYGGARLTGKVGNWDIGIIDMQTAISDSLPSENFGVLRFKRSVFNPFSYAGGIITSRIGADGSYNMLYGLDTYIKVFGDDYLDIRYSQVYDSDFSSSDLTDNSFFRLNWERRTDEGFSYMASFNWSGKDYQPEMGFMRREDYYVFGGRLRYGWIPGNGSILFSHQVFTKTVTYFSTTGEIETGMYGPGYMFTTKNKISGQIELEYMIENLNEEFELSDDLSIPVGEYRFFNLKGELNSPNSLLLNLKSEFDIGQYYDGNRISVKLTPAWSVSPSVKLEGLYQLDKAKFSQRPDFINHIARVKFVYMMNTKVSASAFVQYNSLINATLSNFRIRYNPREGNDLYIVYNEGRNIDLEREVPNIPRFSERSFLVKYTYTFAL